MKEDACLFRKRVIAWAESIGARANGEGGGGGGGGEGQTKFNEKKPKEELLTKSLFSWP